MKYVYALTMLLALGGMLTTIAMGYDYVVYNQGLHPTIASLIVLLLFIAGYVAACMLSDIEEDM